MVNIWVDIIDYSPLEFFQKPSMVEKKKLWPYPMGFLVCVDVIYDNYNT